MRLRPRRADVLDWLEQATVVESVDPFEGCELNSFARTLGTAAVDHFVMKKRPRN
jgi:hypothetical protein